MNCLHTYKNCPRRFESGKIHLFLEENKHFFMILTHHDDSKTSLLGLYILLNARSSRPPFVVSEHRFAPHDESVSAAPFVTIGPMRDWHTRPLELQVQTNP